MGAQAQKRPYNAAKTLDLLRVPLIGRVLMWRWGRLVFQLPLLIVAALILIDGFYGSRFSSGDAASENFATVASWVHYRGLVVLVLLLIGNLFCMGCPFTLPRTLAKRLSLRGRRWPTVLRNKWLAIAGLFLIFFLYEWLDLWASPLLTAWVAVAYFVASFVLEAVFKESAFCKYVCPLGTFNFVHSTASPTQIGVHQPDVCQTCVGKECINGSYAPQPVVLIDQIATADAPQVSHEHNPRGTLGCGTELFAPQMTSNMDCVMCLDCARACPHNNVGLFVRSPLSELTLPDAWRKRWDLILLVVAMAFMGLTNAFGMVPPVYSLIDAMALHLAFLRDYGWSPKAIEALILLVIFGVGNLVLPVAVVVGLSALTKAFVRTKDTLREVAATFAPAFVPIGFGVWLSHYLFHFLIGMWAIVPVLQGFFGFAPNYALVGVSPSSPLLPIVEIGFLLLGFGVSLYVAQRRAVQRYRRQAMPALMPWAFAFLLMMLAAAYIMNLPMEMRGVELFG
ncbi:MAG: FesM [Chloroflexota bacterium]